LYGLLSLCCCHQGNMQSGWRTVRDRVTHRSCLRAKQELCHKRCACQQYRVCSLSVVWLPLFHISVPKCQPPFSEHAAYLTTVFCDTPQSLCLEMFADFLWKLSFNLCQENSLSFILFSVNSQNKCVSYFNIMIRSYAHLQTRIWI
jgi:hypothetical protein